MKIGKFSRVGKVIGLALGLGLVLTVPAMADSIGTTANPCALGSCEGSIYTLSYSGSPVSTDATAMTKTYNIILDVDTSSYASTGGTPGVAIDSVAIKVSASVVNFSLLASPGGTWTAQAGGINAGGCSGAGGGFVCADLTGGSPVPVGVLYSWTFQLEIADAVGLELGAGLSSVKARYIDANGDKTGALTSEPITLMTPGEVPEPSTILLLGSGLAGLGLWRWKTKK